MLRRIHRQLPNHLISLMAKLSIQQSKHPSKDKGYDYCAKPTLDLLDLEDVQLNRGVSPKHTDQHFDLAFDRINL